MDPVDALRALSENASSADEKKKTVLWLSEHRYMSSVDILAAQAHIFISSRKTCSL